MKETITPIERLPEGALLNRVALPLPGGLSMEVAVEPIGLQQPAEGDGLVVAAFVFLPTQDTDNKLIRNELAFGERLTIGLERLFGNWGHPVHPTVGRWRKNRVECTGDTWRAAFAEAEGFLVAEYNKLLAALLARAAALHSDGFEIAAAHGILKGLEPAK